MPVYLVNIEFVARFGFEKYQTELEKLIEEKYPTREVHYRFICRDNRLVYISTYLFMRLESCSEISGNLSLVTRSSDVYFGCCFENKLDCQNDAQSVCDYLKSKEIFDMNVSKKSKTIRIYCSRTGFTLAEFRNDIIEIARGPTFIPIYDAVILVNHIRKTHNASLSGHSMEESMNLYRQDSDRKNIITADFIKRAIESIVFDSGDYMHQKLLESTESIARFIRNDRSSQSIESSILLAIQDSLLLCGLWFSNIYGYALANTVIRMLISSGMTDIKLFDAYIRGEYLYLGEDKVKTPQGTSITIFAYGGDNYLGIPVRK